MTTTIVKTGYDVTSIPTTELPSTVYETEVGNDDVIILLPPGRTLATVLLSILAVLALITNSLLIWLIVRSTQLRTSTNAFIVSIACSDLLQGLLVVLPSASVLQHQNHPERSCAALGVFSVLTQSVTSQSLMMVSVDRCIAVAWSLRYSHLLTKTTVGVMLAGVWLISGVFALLPIIGWGQYHFDRNKLLCGIDWRTSFTYIIAQRTCCFLLPWVVIAIMIAIILKCAFAHRRIFALMPVPGLALAVGAAPVVNYRRSTLQAMKTLFFIVAALTILWTPNFVVDFLNYYKVGGSGGLTRVTMATCGYLAYFSCILNPFVFLFNKKYKQRLKELVSGWSSRIGHSRVYPAIEPSHSRFTTTTQVPSSHESLSCSHVSLSTTSLPNSHHSRHLFIDTKANTLQVPQLITVSPARIRKSSEDTVLPLVIHGSIPDIIVSSVGDDGEHVIHVTPSPSRRSSQETLTSHSPDVIQCNADITIQVPRLCNLSTI